MTAINESTTASTAEMRSALHTGKSESKSLMSLDGVEGPVSTEAARANFSSVASRSVAALMERGGYSRERARAFLLRLIRRRHDHGYDRPPEDHQVFKLMESRNLEMDDAIAALTVARASRRIRSERGLSHSEAFAELAAAIQIEDVTAPDMKDDTEQSTGARAPRYLQVAPSLFSSSPSSSGKGAVQTNSTSFSSTCSVVNAEIRKPTIKCTRKRSHGSLRTEELGSRSKTLLVSTDSVASKQAEEVDAELAKKAEMACANGLGSSRRESRPSRAKRSVSQASEKQPQQPSGKRPRTVEE